MSESYLFSEKECERITNSLLEIKNLWQHRYGTVFFSLGALSYLDEGYDYIDNVNRYTVLFHAKRGIQEINYDALNNIKVLELKVDDDLKFILPPDYVNYVRISVEKDGVIYPLHENVSINYATEYLQDNNNDLLFDQMEKY